MTDHYFVLGVTKEAGLKDIERAYKTLARKHHPDRGGDQLRFQEIVRAYEVLRDESARKEYDVELSENILKDFAVRYVSFEPRIIPVRLTLSELLRGDELVMTARIPCFFDADGREVDAVRRCSFCRLRPGDCSTCRGSGRIVSDQLFCRLVEREVRVAVARCGIRNEFRMDRGTYILFFTLVPDMGVRLRKYDIILRIDVPVANFLKCVPFEVAAHERLWFCTGNRNLNRRYVFPGRGLWKNLVERGDLVVYPGLIYPAGFLDALGNAENVDADDIMLLDDQEFNFM